MKSTLSQAETFGLVSFGTALLLLFFQPAFAVFPLVLYCLTCLVAPFFPQWGFFLPIISKSQTDSRGVALTIDDGPSPQITPLLLELLQKHNFKATFFVIGEKAKQYPDLIRAILDGGHTIGNHSWKHDNFLMLRREERLRGDIRKSQQVLVKYGLRPLVFRPPAGISNPLLKSVLAAEQLRCVTYSCRALDGGNKRIENLAARILQKLRPGNIILLHESCPLGDAGAVTLQREFKLLFNSLEEKGFEVLPLESLIGMPVMESAASGQE